MSVGERRRVSARRDSLLGDEPGAFAVARFARVTPQKARRVVDLVRGLPVDEALALLRFAPQAAAETVYKTLESAVANADRRRGSRPRRPGRQPGHGRRGPDPQAVPAARPGPGVPDPQAHQPHHPRGAAGSRGPVRPRAPAPVADAPARREGPAKWDRRSTRTGSGSASRPTTRAAGTPTSSTRRTSARTSRSAACSPRAWSAPASPRSRSSAPATGSASTSTPPGRASSSAAAAPRPTASAATSRSSPASRCS